MKGKFSLGQVTVTDDAATALREAGQEVAEFLSRHAQGDRGDITMDITVYKKEGNDYGLAHDSREIFSSAYSLKTGQSIWVFTNLKRDKTTVMLPPRWDLCYRR